MILYTAFGAFLVGLVSSEPILVNTRYGPIRGSRTSIHDGSSNIDMFLKIPYAQPPIGELRFRKPKVPEPWTGIRDGTTFGPQCPQLNLLEFQAFPVAFENNEDCLYLNVFVPKVAGAYNLLPVMVWVHGGAYHTGSGNFYNNTILPTKNVVVVTLNFRLGALGFLSTEDSASPGNYGLWDLVEALKWVRECIHAFQGNPDDVTLFGERAGAVMVSVLTLSNAAKGLFHKAILESGSTLNPWAVHLPGLNPVAVNLAKDLAARLGCDNKDNYRLVSCLRTKDAMTLANITNIMREEARLPTLFRPIVESSFGVDGLLPATPKVILESGKFPKVPIIRGNTREEASITSGVGDDGLTWGEFQNRLRTFLDQRFTHPNDVIDKDSLYRLLLDAYVHLSMTNDPFKLRRAWIQLQSDYSFLAATLWDLQLTNQYSATPQYLYQFSFKSLNRLIPYWAGPPHGDELYYVFGLPMIDPLFVSSWTQEDRRVAGIMVKLWSNFAKFSDPTPNRFLGLRWLPWNAKDRNYLDIQLPLKIDNLPHRPEIDLWIDVFKDLYQETLSPSRHGKS